MHTHLLPLDGLKSFLHASPKDELAGLRSSSVVAPSRFLNPHLLNFVLFLKARDEVLSKTGSFVTRKLESL